MVKPVLAVVAGLATAVLGAVILGEYELVGATPLFAGPLFGVVVAEVTATVARACDRFLLGAVALATVAGLVWATWISTGHSLGLAPATAWIGAGLGAVAAPLWFKSAGQRGDRSPDHRTRTPGG